MNTCLAIRNLSFSYGDDLVLNDLHLEMKAGELLVIVGENGSGKSTLLKILIGELRRYEGSVLVCGQPPGTRGTLEKIGYMPQRLAASQISFPVTCLEMVTLNLYRSFRVLKIPTRAAKQKATKLLTDMGLGAYIRTPYRELSGGLQQRVMICRSLINNPDVIIMDEPTAGVDKAGQGHLLHSIDLLRKERGVSIVIVTHELELVRRHLEDARVVRLEEGGFVRV